MSKYCVTVPRIRNKNNELVDSRLYKDLLSYTNTRDQATKLYLKVTSEEFQKTFDNIKYDENGEPTSEYLIKELGVDNYISTENIIRKESKDIGAIDSKGNMIDYEDNISNRKDLSYKTIAFNNRNPFNNELIAVIKPNEKQNGMNIVIERINESNQELAEQIEYSHNLTQRLEDVLNDWGISVGVLTALDKAKGVNGIADFSNMKQTAEGLIELIRISDDKIGLESLPEETAHIVVEAMKDSDLMDRLLNNISQKNLVKQILGDTYDRYNDIYQGDSEKLVKEAAAKLIAEHMLKGQEINQTTPERNLLQRVINYFKNIFKKFSPNSIRNEMLEADKNASELAKKILNKETQVDLDLLNISGSSEYYNVKTSNDKSKALLEEMVTNSMKRLQIYQKKNPNSAFNDKGAALLNNLAQDLENNNIKNGIAKYIDYALNNLSLVDKKLDIIDGDSGLGLNQKAQIILEAMDFVRSFESIAESMEYAKQTDPGFFDDSNEGIKEIMDNYDKVIGIVNKLNTKFLTKSIPIYQEVLRPYIGEGFEIPMGRYKGDMVDMNEVTYKANRDISMFERFLDSIVDSSDYALKALGTVYMKQNEKGRLRTVEHVQQLKAAGLKLEQAGIKNTNWMIEQDSEGNYGYNFISEYNFTQFYQDRNKAREKRDSLIEENEDNRELAEREYNDWLTENSNIVEGKTVPNEHYVNPEFRKIMNPQTEEDAAKKEYYDTIIDMKISLEESFPERLRNSNRRVFLRKGTWERIKDYNNPSDILEISKTALQDTFMERSDDVEMRNKHTLVDFDNNEVMSLPLFYLNKAKGEDINDYATDVTSSMIVYADMANNYKSFSDIVHIMELSKFVLGQREVTQTRGKKILTQALKVLGKEQEIDFTGKGTESNMYKRYEEFLKMQLYNKTTKDSGSLGKVNINKTVGFLMLLTSVKALGINVLQGVANIMTGHVQGIIEGAANEHFSVGDLYKADATYFKNILPFISNIGNRAHTDKLSLWNEKFNTMQDHEAEVRYNEFYKKNWFSRFMNSSTLFMISSMGEHWLQTRSSLALAKNLKLVDIDGSEINLWEAMEPVPIDPDNIKLGMTLELKEGVTKQDGSDFTEQDIIDFGLKVKNINRAKDGTYNKTDANVLSAYALGRMALQFRKWMRDYYMKRYSRAKQNYETGVWEEGYYRALGRLVNNIYRDAKNLEFNLALRYDELNDTEKGNVKRAITDMGITLLLRSLIKGLFSGDDDDDESLPWQFFEYWTRRLLLETGSYTPISLPNEGLELIASPAASFNTAQNVADLFGLFNYENYEFINGEDAIIQSGRYRGKSKAERLILRSPFVPVYDNIQKAMAPKENMGFFNK